MPTVPNQRLWPSRRPEVCATGRALVAIDEPSRAGLLCDTYAVRLVAEDGDIVATLQSVVKSVIPTTAHGSGHLFGHVPFEPLPCVHAADHWILVAPATEA